jgi:hypothetical protein
MHLVGKSSACLAEVHASEVSENAQLFANRVTLPQERGIAAAPLDIIITLQIFSVFPSIAFVMLSCTVRISESA